ncbi:hypothetical protein J6590_034615 [Homalodisca vitripennis]|nr:hypothetical protein J6590_034615 [Homalodisca vitripennis]
MSYRRIGDFGKNVKFNYWRFECAIAVGDPPYNENEERMARGSIILYNTTKEIESLNLKYNQLIIDKRQILPRETFAWESVATVPPDCSVDVNNYANLSSISPIVRAGHVIAALLIYATLGPFRNQSVRGNRVMRQSGLRNRASCHVRDVERPRLISLRIQRLDSDKKPILFCCPLTTLLAKLSTADYTADEEDSDVTTLPGLVPSHRLLPDRTIWLLLYSVVQRARFVAAAAYGTVVMN